MPTSEAPRVVKDKPRLSVKAIFEILGFKLQSVLRVTRSGFNKSLGEQTYVVVEIWDGGGNESIS